MLNNKSLEKKIIFTNVIENLKARYNLNFKNNIQEDNVLNIKYNLLKMYCDDNSVLGVNSSVEFKDTMIPIGSDSVKNNYYLIVLDINGKIEPKKYIIMTNDFINGLHYGNKNIFQIKFID